MAEITHASPNAPGDDLAYHYETYRAFVRYMTIFVVHVAVILALLAYFLG